MARWEPDAHGRLRRAALDLYAERGFEQTTVAEIAERAGLTERTFFRYFTDKREVLFAGSDELSALLVRAVADAPSGARPVELVAKALDAVTAAIGTDRELSRRRQDVIDANPALRERELSKLATLATELGAALRRRRVPEPTASLLAEAGLGAFKVAFDRWIHGRKRAGLPQLAQECLAALGAATNA